MDTVTFVSNLKDTLWNMENYGGNPELNVSPNYRLLGKLKNFVFEVARQKNICFKEDYHSSNFIYDILDKERFERRTRYCIIKLREFGIPEDSYYEYISSALNIVIANFQQGLKYRKGQQQHSKEEKTIENLLIEELSLCFESWYYPNDIFTHDFAKEHQLATFNHIVKKWELTSIGRYMLQLSTFEVILFLCVLEITFGSKRPNSRYLNLEILEKISDSESFEQYYLENNRPLPVSLKWYGIVDNYSSSRGITDFGIRILKKIRANLEALKNLILLLAESETAGIAYKKEDGALITKILECTKSSVVIAQDLKESVERVINLFKQEHYLDSLRLFYTNIESVINIVLMKLGLTAQQISKMGGMKSKLEKLEKENILTSKMSIWVEVVTSRNKVIHGNIVEEDSEIIKPLFNLIGEVWLKLIEEIESRFR